MEVALRPVDSSLGSPINAVAIRDSTFGSYLESINTGGTWFQRVQEMLGYTNPKPLTALDAFYVAAGVGGVTLLAIPLAAGTTLTLPVLAVGTVLTGLSAVGMSEEERREKIGSGIAAGTLVVFQPSAAAFVVKEAYAASKETVKQSVELAKTTVGLTTAGLGFLTTATGTLIVLEKVRRNKRKR